MPCPYSWWQSCFLWKEMEVSKLWQKKECVQSGKLQGFCYMERGMVLMGINVRVQKPVNKGKVILCHAKPDQDLQECLHCKYFYGNSRQCIVQDCTKKTARNTGKLKACTCLSYIFILKRPVAFSCNV